MGNLESSANMARIAAQLAASRALLASAPAPECKPRAQRGNTLVQLAVAVAVATVLALGAVQATSSAIGTLAQAVEVHR